MKICTVEDCTDRAACRGLCNKHYKRVRRYGTAVGRTWRRQSPPTTPREERFWAKVERSDGCWAWVGARSPKGYGQLRTGGRLEQAHRVSYEIHVGPVPDGLELDHLCHVRHCVNPEHLEPVTHAENNRRRLSMGGVRHV